MVDKKKSKELHHYEIKPVQTRYIKPNESLDILLQEAGKYLEDGDFLIISETPVSISQGRLVDESLFKPSLLAVILAELWAKYLWGYILGPVFHIKKRTIKNLRRLPTEARAHKEVVLKYYGLKHALKPASEAGIDLSNVPGSMVSLLPHNPKKSARELSQKIKIQYKKEVVVMIIDTDATYQLGKWKFTCLPIAMNGIKSNLGILGYLMGRFCKMIGPTPLGASSELKIEDAMELANMAEDYQKSIEGHLETVYSMKESFKGNVDSITEDMLDSIPHTPAVIIKRKLD